MRIIIGSDHAGFALKETVKSYLSSAGYRVFDAGTHREESVDYPDYGVLAAERVSSGEFEKGILICGSGVGMAIVANKFPGIRAAVCLDEETARLSRQHNDSNILVLAGRKTEPAAAETDHPGVAGDPLRGRAPSEAPGQDPPDRTATLQVSRRVRRPCHC